MEQLQTELIPPLQAVTYQRQKEEEERCKREQYQETGSLTHHTYMSCQREHKEGEESEMEASKVGKENIYEGQWEGKEL